MVRITAISVGVFVGTLAGWATFEWLAQHGVAGTWQYIGALASAIGSGGAIAELLTETVEGEDA